MLTGERIGPLRIVRLLGAGGMGEVYLARDARLERQVAVKLLLDSEARERMVREARAASGLRHPGIVTIYDIGEHEGLTYIAMEHVEGETFEAMVARRGPLAPAEAVELVAQVGDALATAHDAGILHRDIKSANLMIDDQGRAKVLDFGLCKRTGVSEAPEPRRPSAPAPIVPPAAPTVHEKRRTSDGPRRTRARSNSPRSIRPDGERPATSKSDEPQTEAGVRLGTPGWAPPELMEGRAADVRSDVYSLGVVLYHLLTGQLPFPGYNWAMVRMDVARGALPPSRLVPSIPPALDALILRALAVEPDLRPASMRELVARARAALDTPRRRRVRVAQAARAIAVAAGVSAAILRVSRGEPDPRAPGPVAPAAAARSAASAAPAAAPMAAISFSAPERLTTLGGCAFSPAFIDHDTVTFDLTRDGNVDLYRLDLGAGAPQRLTEDPGWEWRSVPGRHAGEVAFDRSPSAMSNQGAIEALDLASGRRTVIEKRSTLFAFAGDTLYYVVDGKLRRRLARRDEVMLALPADEFIRSITAAGDGSRLALLVASRRGVKLCLVATDTARMTCPVVPEGMAGRPAFAADASAVYFDLPDGIGRLRLAGEAHEVVLPGVVAKGGIAVSPDGRAMVWSDCGQTAELIDMSTDPPRTVEGHSPAFGPGGRLAFASDRAGTNQLIVREPDGTDREIVRHASGWFTDITFSPDGEWLAFVLQDASEPGIYLASLQGLDLTNRLTEDAGDARPYFVGDGLVFTRRDHDRVPRVMRINLDGSEARAVSRRPRLTIGFDGTEHRALLASQDREWLYWWDPVTGRESPGPVKPESRPSITDLWLSPDGRWLLYQGTEGRATWRLRLDGKSSLELLRHQDDVTATQGAIDSSGRALIVVQRWIGDLWTSRPKGAARW